MLNIFNNEAIIKLKEFLFRTKQEQDRQASQIKELENTLDSENRLGFGHGMAVVGDDDSDQSVSIFLDSERRRRLVVHTTDKATALISMADSKSSPQNQWSINKTTSLSEDGWKIIKTGTFSIAQKRFNQTWSISNATGNMYMSDVINYTLPTGFSHGQSFVIGYPVSHGQVFASVGGGGFRLFAPVSKTYEGAVDLLAVQIG